MARNPKTAAAPKVAAPKTAAAPAAAATNDPGADMQRIAEILKWVAEKGQFRDSPAVAQIADAAGKGLPVEDVEEMLADAGLSPDDPRTRTAHGQLRVALALGKRFLRFVKRAEEAKEADASITTSALAWATRMGKVAVEQRILTDDQVAAHSDAQPTYKSDHERGLAKIKQALTLLETAGKLMELPEADAASWAALLSEIADWQPEGQAEAA